MNNNPKNLEALEEVKSGQNKGVFGSMEINDSLHLANRDKISRVGKIRIVSASLQQNLELIRLIEDLMMQERENQKLRLSLQEMGAR